MIDAVARKLLHDGLRMEGDAQTGRTDHFNVVCAVAAAEDFTQGCAVELREHFNRAALASGVKDSAAGRAHHVAGEEPVFDDELVAYGPRHAELFGDGARDEREAPGNDVEREAVAARKLHEDFRADGKARGFHRMVDDAHRRARKELHAALEVLRKGPFSFHGFLRHLAHFVEAACGKGHVIDAFVFDQGAVHVEEECLEGLDAEAGREDEEVGIVPGGFRLEVREVGIVGDILKTKRRFGRTIKRACGVHFMREVEEQIVLQLCAGDHNVEHGGIPFEFLNARPVVSARDV